ncbi:hypothetical protein G6O69_17120 [Pseudenhygromyxa sp. WMMC2535]|nr:hypothetical protein [Pseudenhygromyxa sp. WMMC2535]
MAMLPDFLNPDERIEFFVEALPGTDFEIVAEEELTVDAMMLSDSDDGKALRMFRGIGAVVIGVPLIFMVMAVDGAKVSFIIGSVILTVVAISSMSLIKKFTARKAFTRMNASLERVDANHIALNIDCATTKLLNSVTAKLEVEETATSGSGTDSTSYRELLYENVQEAYVGVMGESKVRLEFDIPDVNEIGWSFSARSNHVSWSMVVEFDIEGWPDREEKLMLELLPATTSDHARTAS